MRTIFSDTQNIKSLIVKAPLKIRKSLNGNIEMSKQYGDDFQVGNACN